MTDTEIKMTPHVSIKKPQRQKLWFLHTSATDITQMRLFSRMNNNMTLNITRSSKSVTEYRSPITVFRRPLFSYTEHHVEINYNECLMFWTKIKIYNTDKWMYLRKTFWTWQCPIKFMLEHPPQTPLHH